MNILTEIFIVAAYLATIMGLILFLAFVCRVGDLGIMFLGWLDDKIQNGGQTNKQTAKEPSKVK